MFEKVLDDLKDCERDLQMIADVEKDGLISNMLRSIIYTIKDTQKNICSIADDCRLVPNVTNTEQEFAKFETAGELLEFLLGLGERDLMKPVVIGRNEWDDNMYMRYVGVVYDVDWVRNDSNEVIICSK